VLPKGVNRPCHPPEISSRFVRIRWLRSSAEHRRAFVAVVLASVVLVLLRSYIFVRYGPAFFDSDQAVVGLMAKHLSEGRGFPLFFYGQNYMLGVESWMAVPFFWLGGPTVAMLRAPLVLVNIAVVLTAIFLFVRRGLTPGFAFVAALPLIATTPILSVELLTVLGASAEPFLYLLILWALRRHAAVSGAVFCLACLHREFCLLALPAIAVALWLEGRSWSLKQWLGAMVAIAAVWCAIDVLKWHVNTLGPDGGARQTSSLGQEARILGSWLSFEWSSYAARLRSLLSALPELLGARRYALRDWALDDTLRAGSTVAGVAMAVAAALAVARLVVAALTRRRESVPGGLGARLALPVYLGVVALETIAVYGLNGGIDPRAAVVTRYVLFVLLAPVALFGGWLLVEHHRGWRAAIVACVAVWSAMTMADNARWLLKLRATPPRSEFRFLADDLMAHGVRYGRAEYWDAYVVTFFAREQVVLASTDKVRMSAYQTLVDAHAAEAVTIQRWPCEGGRRVGSWCVVEPHSP
jgi:hypothetical protein